MIKLCLHVIGFCHWKLSLKWNKGTRSSNHNIDWDADETSYQAGQHFCRRRGFFSENFSGLYKFDFLRKHIIESINFDKYLLMQGKRVQKCVESLDVVKISNEKVKPVIVTTKWETFEPPPTTPPWELFDWYRFISPFTSFFSLKIHFHVQLMSSR